ncbi:MAG TPA: polysaccharide biosynthesis/export family protein, partial [archaeon]|nr:polysaccharide biosynthesis/export family protein [archaeon]
MQISKGRTFHQGKISAITFDCCRVWLAVGLLPILAAGQSQSSVRIQGSELGRENLSRVAASAAEIKIVLVKDPGLLVELKRWVAKDATGHGQIVRDSDLTDDAIFLRLENDLPFRSVATELVQRYGYLRPQLNPASDLAKERELLAQERAKWLAQEEEEERTRSRQRSSAGLQTARGCDASWDSACAEIPRGGESLANEPPPAGEAERPGNRGEETQRENRSQRESPVDRTQLMQPGEELSDELGGLSSEESFSLNASAAGFPSAGLDAGLSGGDFGRAGIASGALPVANAVSGAGRDGAESIDGAAIAATGLLWDADSGSSGRISGAPPSGGTTARMGAPGAASASPRAPSSSGLVRKPSPYDDIPSLYDMYMQAAPRPREPKRFGLDVFARGTRDAKLIPMDLPAGPDYVVGPGDGLTIDLWGGVSRRVYRTVDREGRVSLPEVGPIPVSGKSLADVQLSVQQVLRSQFRDVSADVSL